MARTIRSESSFSKPTRPTNERQSHGDFPHFTQNAGRRQPSFVRSSRYAQKRERTHKATLPLSLLAVQQRPSGRLNFPVIGRRCLSVRSVVSNRLPVRRVVSDVSYSSVTRETAGSEPERSRRVATVGRTRRARLSVDVGFRFKRSVVMKLTRGAGIFPATFRVRLRVEDRLAPCVG